jgi:hypothetical protein
MLLKLITSICCVLLLHIGTCAQSLTAKHQKQLNSIQDPRKKLIRYYKFFRKDSASNAKREMKAFKKSVDSTLHAEELKDKVQRLSKRKPLRLKKLMAKIPGTALLQGTSHKAEQVQQEMKSMQEIPSGIPPSKVLSTDTDKIDVDAITPFPNVNLPGTDIASFPLSSLEIDSLSSMKTRITTEDILQKRKAEVAERAEKILEESNALPNAQRKVSALLSKYREFTNSNDLSSAVKQKSLRGKSFFERLVVDMNANMVSTDPFAIDVSLSIGYKVNKNFSFGLGGSRRIAFADSIENTFFIAPSALSYRSFIVHDLYKGFFAHAEWQKCSFKSPRNESGSKDWTDDIFIGVGKRVPIHPRFFMTLTALYNLKSEDENPLYSRRFQLRVGIQTSELAIRRKKLYYNPNG